MGDLSANSVNQMYDEVQFNRSHDLSSRQLLSLDGNVLLDNFGASLSELVPFRLLCDDLDPLEVVLLRHYVLNLQQVLLAFLVEFRVSQKLKLILFEVRIQSNVHFVRANVVDSMPLCNFVPVRHRNIKLFFNLIEVFLWRSAIRHDSVVALGHVHRQKLLKSRSSWLNLVSA